jgi:hypothetical protein
MYRYLVFAVFFSLAGCVGLFSKPGLDFDSNRVHLIDEVNGAYFFRGNEPLIGDEKNRRFAYAELISVMNNRLEQEGHEKLTRDNFELIDISLLNSAADEFDLKIEKEILRG